jgi:RND family efflux transporter MFP subunit
MRKVLLPVLILALALGGFLLLKATRPAAPPVEVSERSWRVDAVRIQPEQHHPESTLYGRVETPDRWRAAAPVSGRVQSVWVRDGEAVEVGKALLSMDPRDLAPRLELARADLERERLRYRQDQQALERERELARLAEAKVRRAERLSASQLGSERELDQAREDFARASLSLLQREQAIAEHPARLAQLQARLDEADRDQQRGNLVAPFAGRVGRVEVAPGDQLGVGQPLLTLYPLDGFYLRARLPERYVAVLAEALQRDEALTASMLYAGRAYTARLERLGAEADVRGIDAWLHLDGRPDVPVGSLLAARLQGPKLEAVSLPFSALHGGERVYLIEDRRLRGIPVQLLGERRVNGQVEMLIAAQALPAGALVMRTHLPNAIDGLLVDLAEEVPGE